jgi:tRNA pseudouridine55 synthase
MNGILVIDKPAGMTSHDVVSRVRGLLRERSVGHLGTLDPMATGVLPLVLGGLTRLSQFYDHAEKSYEGEIRFGFATDTYDAEGEPTEPRGERAPALEEVRALVGQFRGLIWQVPPPFSAKKVHGVPAYKLARKSRPVELKPVEVEVKEFEILGMTGDCARFRARVASGTYMRSVAHEMGRILGMGAHLACLRRMAVAEFGLADAHPLEEVAAAAQDGGEERIFVPLRRVLPALPSVTASEEAAALIRNGRAVNLAEFSAARQVKVFCGQNQLIAVAERMAGTLFHPKVVFAGA